MLLTCEKCETIFRIEETMLTDEQQRVRCSVCAHVWEPPRNKPIVSDNELITETASRLRVPTILLLTIMLVSTGLYMFRGLVTAQVPELIAPFEFLGVDVGPDISSLSVQNLKADYQGNLLRIRGSVINTASFRAHAAPLQVTIFGEDKTMLATQRILPDDRFIDAGGMTEFFLQVEVENAAAADVRVVPVAERLQRSFF
ncbi:MAG: zinc-ribbon domain-containing protein [Alphaproteobacteria bacterium]|nr:zinc-ribbon domain-containing protein [Alphaproteobacteria bacterium]